MIEKKNCLFSEQVQNFSKYRGYNYNHTILER